jgi:hypothetical protein
MEDFRNVNLQTVAAVVLSKGSQMNFGGLVAAGKKRYVTFLCVDGISAVASFGIVILASVTTDKPSNAQIIATANCKMRIPFRLTGCTAKNNYVPGNPPLQIPARIDPDKPLFSIAGGAYLAGAATGASAYHVFVQYYDE